MDLQTSSVTGTTTIRTDAEVVLNNTELFVEPQLGEQNLLAVEPQLSDSKTSAQRSNTSYPAHEKARLEGLVSGVSTDERRTLRFSEKDLITDHEHVDGITQKTPAKEGEEEQDHSQQNDPMEQFSESEEMAGSEYNGLGIGGCRYYLKSRSDWVGRCSGNAKSWLEAVIEHLMGRQGQPRGAQMRAVYLNDWEGWSQDPSPPRPHLRIGSGSERYPIRDLCPPEAFQG